MAIIKSPNKSYTGVSASVAFANGQGKTDNPHLKEWFKNHGYEVEEEKANPSVPFESMTIDGLKKYADDLEIKYDPKVTKDELISIITDNQAGKKNE